MLILENVYATYGSTIALREVSLTVERGELVVLVGRNGVGKTTLLSTIAGIVRPTYGVITFQGETIVGRRPEDVVRRGIALVPAGRRILSSLTVKENLLLGASIRGNRVEVHRDLERMCVRFPILGQRLNQRGGTLSGGEQQQLAIARALMSRPQLLLLDEPTLGLAPLLVKEVLDLVAQLHISGGTVLLVEQNLERVQKMADRVYQMNAGQVESTGMPWYLPQPAELSETRAVQMV